MVRRLLYVCFLCCVSGHVVGQSVDFVFTAPRIVRGHLHLIDSIEHALEAHADRVVLESIDIMPVDFSGKHFRRTDMPESHQAQWHRASAVRAGEELLVQYPATKFDLLGAVHDAASDRSEYQPYVPNVRRLKVQIDAHVGDPYPIVHAFRAGARAQAQPWRVAVANRYRLRVDGEPVVLWSLAPSRGGPSRILHALERRARSSSVPDITIDRSGKVLFSDPVSEDDMTAEWQAALQKAGFDLLTLYASEAQRIQKRLNKGDDVALRLPVVASNMQFDDEAMQSLVRPFAIQKFGSLRIAVLSLISQGSQRATYAKTHGIHIHDPIDEASRHIRTLRTEDRADFIACVSLLSADDEARLTHGAVGCDTILSHDEYTYRSLRSKSVVFESRTELEVSTHPALVAYFPSGSYSSVRASFTRRNVRWVPRTLVERRGPVLMHSRHRSSFDRLTRHFVERYTRAPRALLPDPRKLWPGKDQKKYHSVEFWRIAAHALRGAGKTELGIIHMLPSWGGAIGEVNEPYVRGWLKYDTGVRRGKIRGSVLRKMLAYQHPGPIDEQGEPVRPITLQYEPYLAIAGVDARGEVNGAPIRDDELYSITLSTDLLEHADFPELQLTGKVAQLDGQRKDVIVDWIANQRAELSAAEFHDLIRDAAEQAAHDRLTWRFELRELSASFANTSVRNGRRLPAVRDAKVQSIGQLTARAELDVHSVMRWQRMHWDTGIGIDYGRVLIRPTSGETITNETADQLLLTTDFGYRAAYVPIAGKKHSVGPFLRLAYDTEFSAPTGIRSRKSFFIKPGVQLYDGRYLERIFANAIIEADLADGSPNTEYGYELGARVTVPLMKNGLRWHLDANYVDFALSDNDTADDLRRTLDLQTSLSVPVWGNLRLRPYFKYYLFSGKTVKLTGHNMLIGVAFDLSALWKPIF